MDMPTPGATKPLLTKDPIGTEGEMTPGPDDETPFDKEEERRDWRRFRQTQAGREVPNRDTPPGTTPDFGTALNEPPVLDAPEHTHGERDDRHDGLPDDGDGRGFVSMVTGE